MTRRFMALALFGALIVGQVLALAVFPAGAADHLDAPGLTSPAPTVA